jgi:hypothetical protein
MTFDQISYGISPLLRAETPGRGSSACRMLPSAIHSAKTQTFTIQTAYIATGCIESAEIRATGVQRGRLRAASMAIIGFGGPGCRSARKRQTGFEVTLHPTNLQGNCR